MLALPDRVEVQVLVEDGRSPADILVSLYFYSQGHYYYGHLAGSTDAQGRAATTADEIRRRFEESRRLFMMDLRVPLADCDPRIDVVIDGGVNFAERQAEPLPSYVPPDVRMLWDRARNAFYAPASVSLHPPWAKVVRAQFTLRPVGADQAPA